MRSSSAVEVVAEPAHSDSISLKLRDINQLFNSMDPSPFIEKDLDDKAEEFIVGWAHEFPPDAHVKLRVHLEQWPTQDDPKELIHQAVHNHFAHRAEVTDLEFKGLMKQGRTSLLIGLSCLATSLVISKVLLHGAAGTWASVLRKSLTIAGWVAMWRPMQIYLYDWWPLRRRARIYAKLSGTEHCVNVEQCCPAPSESPTGSRCFSMESSSRSAQKMRYGQAKIRA